MSQYLLTVLSILLIAAPAAAENCPVKHPALTALDHASMLAAYTASFRGIYGRNPTMAVGSGVDDGNYWIAVSDHYGEFGDSICRAGWNAYWETKLATGQDAVNPTLGDQPARFQPESTPPPVVIPPPPPTPPPVTPPVVAADNTAVLAAIADLKATMQAEHAEQTNAVKTIGRFLADHWSTIAAGIGAYLAGHQVGK